MYDANYFIQQFEAIPEDKWHKYMGGDRISDWPNWKGDHATCALGHCNRIIEKTGEHGIVNEFTNVLPRYAQIIYGEDPKYQQETPKQRIMAALYDVAGKPKVLLKSEVDIFLEQLEKVNSAK